MRTFFLALALLGLSEEAQAQLLGRLPLSLQGRVGEGIPTGGFAERDPGIGAETGLAFELGAILEPTSWLGIYAGYQQARHGCGECGEVGLDDTALATGGEAGAQLTLPTRALGVRPWARAGAVRQSLRLSRRGSALVADPALGYGLGAGVQIPTPFLVLSPGVRYQSYTAQFELGTLPSRGVEVSYLTIDLGVLLRF